MAFRLRYFQLLLQTSKRHTVNSVVSRKYSLPVIENVKPHSLQSLFQPEEVKSFQALYPTVIETIIKQGSEMPEVAQRIKSVISRMLPHERNIDGLKVTTLYKMLDPPEKRTQEKIFVSGILGWCADLLVCGTQIFDDILDHDETRFGNPCLHKYDDVKWEAVNFGIIVENAPHYLLKEFCSQYSWYTPCLELTRQFMVNTSLGQTLEEMSRVDGKPVFERFTKENSLLVNKYKAVSEGVLMPLMYAMFASGNYDLGFPKVAAEVLDEIGIFISIQDDMTDYEIPKREVSLTCDASEGKCSWLVMQILENGTKAQKQLIYTHYGKKDMTSLNIINKLYEDFGIFDLYKDYKQKSYNFVWEKTKTLPIKEEHRQLLWNYINMMYEKQIN